MWRRPSVALARTGFQMEKGEILANEIPNNPDPDWDQTTTNIKDANPELIDPCDDFDGKCPTVSHERAFACGSASLDSWCRVVSCVVTGGQVGGERWE